MKKIAKKFEAPEFPTVPPEIIKSVKETLKKGRDYFEKITWTSHGGIGSAETSLTGTQHLIQAIRETGEEVNIILDCGMFQGKGRERNPELPVNPGVIQHVIVTHGHNDHCGKLPLLTKERSEFTGEIHCTPVTWETALISLKDSAKISEDGYDEEYRKYVKLVHEVQSSIKIVRSAESKGIPKDRRNGNRLKGTGELCPSQGEGKGGSKIKNRIRGGAAIHDLPESKVQEARKILAENGFYDLNTQSFVTGASISKNIPAPKKNLYDLKDVNRVEYFIKTHKYDERFELEPGVEATFYNAGHIAGSAMVVLRFKIDEHKTYNVMFSGDLGRLRGEFHPYGKPSLPISEPIDTFAHETTYGGKRHLARELAVENLGRVIREAYLNKRKALIIPTFAIERCASLLHALIELKKQEYFDGEIILDSPLGIQQTMVAGRHAEDEAFCENIMNKRAYRITKGEDRSGLDKTKKFRVIVTGSGMANGGPILDYLKLYSNNPDIEFAFAGYQSEGTIGNELTTGYKSITVDGLKLAVKAKINLLMGFSAHADEEDLFAIMGYAVRSKRYGARHKEAKLLLVHGERDISTAAFVNYLERRAREGKRGIPKPNNIFIPNLEEQIVLYDNAPILIGNGD